MSYCFHSCYLFIVLNNAWQHIVYYYINDLIWNAFVGFVWFLNEK